MTASGVCHSDLHVRDGDWERPGPIVIGHEGAGVIEAVGAGLDPSRRRPLGRPLLVRALPALPRVPARPPVAVLRVAVAAPRAGRRHDAPRPRRRLAGPRLPLDRHDGHGPGRPGDRGGPDARRRAARGRGADRLRRVDRRRRRDQDGRGAGRLDGGRHRPRRRRAVVRDGRRAGRCAADRRGGREPGEDRPRRLARGDALGPGRSRQPARGRRRHPRRGGRRRSGLRVRGDRAAGDDRAGDRGAAAGRDGGARRPDGVRPDRALRGVPVRRRRPPDHRLQLRLGGGRDRLPALRRGLPRGPPAHRPPHRPPPAPRRTSRTPSTASAPARRRARSWCSREPALHSPWARGLVAGLPPGRSPAGAGTGSPRMGGRAR